uniref:Rab-GAP TBC domain-containing protein n=1 Tax=Arcella intermedia TaxID=1963864 RepID=A0A6B2L7P7_9EUKA
MFLRNSKFLEEERNAPLLDRNNNYLEGATLEALFERASEWPGLVGATQGYKVENVGVTNSNRIIMADAERTFLDPTRRKTLVRILSCYENKFGDYHQGLSLFSGFLLLTLPEQAVANIAFALATQSKYIPEYWRAEAVAAATDAYVWEHLLQKHFPELAQCLKSHKVLPETFCQKWFVALCVSVLPFSALFNFFEYFFKQGHLYLFKFGLTLVSTFKDQIFKSQDYEIYSFLRFDKDLTKKHIATDDIMIDVVERAANFQLVPFDITSVRKDVYEVHLRARLERARQLQKEAEEESSEDLSSTNSDDSDDSEGAECASCKENAPDMWCVPCKKLLCEKCHKAAKGQHKKNHKVDEDWEKYDKK